MARPMDAEPPRVNAEVKSMGRPAVNERPRKIRERSFAYALRAVKLFQYLQKRKDGGGWLLGK